MTFNSAEFLLFAVFFFPLYYSIKNLRKQNILLLIASYIFYGYWDYRFLFLLLFSTVIDFFAAIKIQQHSNERIRKTYLILSLGANLAILGTFKYAGFFVESMHDLLSAFGMKMTYSTMNIVLPVGISFYTFQAMGYAIDVYRKRIEPMRDFVDYSLFITYFPQLVAGPIEAAENLAPQLQRKRTITMAGVKQGIFWILWGYCLKVGIADSLESFVAYAFANPTEVSGVVSLTAIVAFGIQIYGDFAGYSIIARGLSKFLGIDLMSNFERPYLATSPNDFWRRWHVSLSGWFKHNVYIPLGGNRCGNFITYRNYLITFFIAGLWHGARWNFVLWGVFHGLALVLWRPTKSIFVNRCITLLIVFVGWALFRVANLKQLQEIVVNIFSNFHWTTETFFYLKPTLTFLVFFLACEVMIERKPATVAQWAENRWIRMGVVIFLIISAFAVRQHSIPFIYFQF